MMKWILLSLLIVIGLLLLIQKKSRHGFFHQEKEERKILLVSALILFWVALLGELSGLGVLDKIDKIESYQIIFQQLQVILPVFLISIIAGVLLLFWQVSPLVHKMVRSEKRTLYSNKLLKESENRFRSAFDFASIGMALVSLQGQWLKANSSLCEMLGYTEDEFPKMDIQMITHMDDLPELENNLRQLEHGNIANVQMEKRLLTRSGYVMWALVNASLVCDENHKPTYFILQIQDVGRQKFAEEQLRHMAYHDALTGLDNRMQIEKNLRSALEFARQDKKYFALIYLDLDHFKEVNDSLGHEAGDNLLMTVATRLQTALRHSDKIGRLGGDEFVIIVENFLNPDFILDLVRKLQDSLASPVKIKAHDLYVTASIGIACYPLDGTDIATLMLNADKALYRVKEKGRNNFQFFGDVPAHNPEATLDFVK